MTMAYILVINPTILSATGMSFEKVFAATAIISAVATLVMGLVANLPFVLSAGMGLNAFFAYTVCLGMGYSWRWALTAILCEGLIFLALTFFNVREAIVNSIPPCLKKAIGAGIGFFIAFIGLQNAGIVVGGATLVELSADWCRKIRHHPQGRHHSQLQGGAAGRCDRHHGRRDPGHLHSDHLRRERRRRGRGRPDRRPCSCWRCSSSRCSRRSPAPRPRPR